MDWESDDEPQKIDIQRKLTEEEIESIVKGLRFANVQNPIQEGISFIHQDKTRKKLKTITIKESKIPDLKKRILYHFYNSIVAPGEAVGVNAAQCIGEPTTQLTLNSVAPWENILLKNSSNNITRVCIGDWINDLIKNNGIRVKFIPTNNTEYLELADAVHTPSTNELGVITWELVTAVTRHYPQGNLFKVSTRSGRTVTVSASKSLLVWDGSQLVDVDAPTVRIGDKVPILANFPKSVESSGVETPVGKIEFDAIFGKIIAYLLIPRISSIEDKCVSFILHKPDAAEIQKWCNKFSLETVIVDEFESKVLLNIENIPFAKWLLGWIFPDDRICVPTDLFNAPIEFIINIIKGYIMHGRNIIKDTCTIYDQSPAIIKGMSILFSMVGIHGDYTMETGRSNYIVSGTDFERLQSICNNTSNEITREFKMRLNDVILDEISAIEEIPPTEYVYDLTVPTTKNFTIWDGFCVRDTFHSAGISAKNVTLGFPRATELFNATKSPANPTCTIYFKHNNSMPHTLHSIVDKIPETIIDQIITSIKIYTPGDHPFDYWHTVWMKLHSSKQIDEYEWCLRLNFDMQKLYSKSLTLIEIAEVINSNFIDVRCIASPLNICIIDVFVNCVDVKSANEEEASDTDRLFYMEKIVSPKIRGLYICGIYGITQVYRRKAKCNEIFGNYPLKPELLEKLKGKSEEWIIDTDGTNLAEVMALSGVDPYRTISNDLWELSRMLGIEAVRNYLFVEFMNIVSSGGTSINPVHIEMLVDKMTYTGGIRAITRFGIETSQYDPIARATFEHVMDHLNTSAIFSETDHLSGISSNVVTGKPINAGTGAINLEKIPLHVTTVKIMADE